MPLVKSTLEQSLKKAFKDSLDSIAGYSALNAKLEEAADIFSKQASEAIDAYIKTATIVVPAGQAVVAGTSAGSTTTPSLPANIS
jgi:hypothetical protein